MVATETTAIVLVDDIDLGRIETTSFGDPLPTYLRGTATVSGHIVTPGGARVPFTNTLLVEERDELYAVLDSFGERTLADIIRSLR